MAALAAEGTSIIADAAELRVKETDRLAVMARQLRAIGAELEETDDGSSLVGNGSRVPMWIAKLITESP